MRETYDSKTAEKEYLRRAGGGAWEREKPFSPVDTDKFQEGLALLHDFAAALWLLQPSPDDRILDLGAGGGWCSDLLHRLSRRAFPVDISLDMLRVARQRPTRWPLPATVGDLERLPFRDGVFDKAVCLNALHHVPNVSDALREVSRVLSDRGVAVFSEPGIGHTSKPWSLAATRDFGVLEQEIRIEPTIRACRQAGFANVHVCPMSYVIPEFTLNEEEWNAWMRLPRTKRPFRAANKIWRAVLEMFGLAKRGALFEEAFAMRLVRLLQVPVQEHPFIVAAKTVQPRRSRPVCGATIDLEFSSPTVDPGCTFQIAASVTNTGTDTWRAQSNRFAGVVQLGIQLLDADLHVIDRDFKRIPLPKDIQPGESIRLQSSGLAPATSGEYNLKLDMVSEGRTWFEPVGSPTRVVPLKVLSALSERLQDSGAHARATRN
jgi:ubiquinone/menaquinone biosynthesis C-methylase UbiE